jgi:hypothetical protein
MQVAVYDIGVFSCRRILSWPTDLAWPELVSVGTEHNVRCWLYHSDPAHGHVAPLGASAEAETAASRRA